MKKLQTFKVYRPAGQFFDAYELTELAKALTISSGRDVLMESVPDPDQPGAEFIVVQVEAKG